MVTKEWPKEVPPFDPTKETTQEWASNYGVSPLVAWRSRDRQTVARLPNGLVNRADLLYLAKRKRPDTGVKVTKRSRIKTWLGGSVAVGRGHTTW